MDRELAEYRARKQKFKKEKVSNGLFNVFGRSLTLENTHTSNSLTLENRTLLADEVEPEDSAVNEAEISPELDQSLSKIEHWLLRVTFALKCLLWCVLMILFVKLEFGAVFFVVSGLYLIWTNLRSSPKRKGELSAYSVFNPNCETIQGTLTAEQFERELKFGSTSVK